MEPNAKTQIKVGIFLAIGLAVAMFSIFMIGGTGSMFSRQMRLHAHFDQVQGLATGSVVSLAGLTVGNIEEIKFLPSTSKLDVIMTIDAHFASRMTEGSMVEIRTQGALGDKFIYIVPSDPNRPPLADGAILPPAPASDLFGVFAERGKETEKIFDIIHELHIMTKSINNEGRLEKTMTNLALASDNLRSASDQAKLFSSELQAKETSAQIRQSAQSLQRILKKIDQGEGTLGALINDSSLHDQLQGLLGSSPRKKQMRSLIRTSIQSNDR